MAPQPGTSEKSPWPGRTRVKTAAVTRLVSSKLAPVNRNFLPDDARIDQPLTCDSRHAGMVVAVPSHGGWTCSVKWANGETGSG